MLATLAVASRGERIPHMRDPDLRPLSRRLAVFLDNAEEKQQDRQRNILVCDRGERQIAYGYPLYPAVSSFIWKI